MPTVSLFFFLNDRQSIWVRFLIGPDHAVFILIIFAYASFLVPRATCQCRIVKMNCEVCSLDSSADSVMWTCIGCTRQFHAACVGVLVQRNSLRKKDKKVDTSSYVLPCCSSCQILITATFEFNVLVEQQAKLTHQINKNTEVTHRFEVHQNNMTIIRDAVDRLEVSLADMRKQLTVARTSDLTDIKNHLTSLCDSISHQTKLVNQHTKFSFMQLKKSYLAYLLNLKFISMVTSISAMLISFLIRKMKVFYFQLLVKMKHYNLFLRKLHFWD